MSKRNTVCRMTAMTALGVALCATQASSALAAREGDLGTLFKVNDDDPKQGIPSEEQRNANPLEFGYYLQDMTARAQGAFHEEIWDEAIKYYEGLALTLPRSPISFRKLCTAYESKGDLKKAEAYCWAVLQRSNIKTNDHFKYLRIALTLFRSTSDTEVRAARTQMIDSSIQHLREQVAANAQAARGDEPVAVDEELDEGGPDDSQDRLPLGQRIELASCQLAAHLGEPERLSQCVNGLKAAAADAKLIVPFDWAAKRVAGDVAGQAAVLARAKELGMPEAALKAMAEPASVPVPPKPAVAEPRAAQDEQSGAVLAADGPPVPPSSTSGLDVEAWIAALAGILGLGAGGWLLRKQMTGQGRTTAEPKAQPTK